MAQVLNPDGTQREVKPANGETFTLQELQTLVGGYIEVVWNTRPMIINEEGKLAGLPRNHRATAIASSRLQNNDYIAGVAVIVSREEMGE